MNLSGKVFIDQGPYDVLGVFPSAISGQKLPPLLFDGYVDSNNNKQGHSADTDNSGFNLALARNNRQ